MTFFLRSHEIQFGQISMDLIEDFNRYQWLQELCYTFLGLSLISR
ncbi:MAG: hypothetical protein ACI9L9_002720 [Marivirga sp.]|jgi:hypothetical protein